jgi:hypothetical protein
MAAAKDPSVNERAHVKRNARNKGSSSAISVQFSFSRDSWFVPVRVANRRAGDSAFNSLVYQNALNSRASSKMDGVSMWRQRAPAKIKSAASTSHLVCPFESPHREKYIFHNEIRNALTAPFHRICHQKR